MCGICGFYQTEGEADTALLKRMNDRITHRGPDDEGFHLEGNVGLANRRLSIIDLSTGHQPLASASGECWIAFNGEIYNYRELRRDLLNRGIPLRTTSDTEVVVNLYEQYGLDFLQHLRGMFAVAIFDRRRDRLVLARDRVGKKPLYYSRKSNGTLVFGSEIKAILPYPGIGRDIDAEALDLFLTLEYIPAPHSIFRAIRKLPAGHLLVYENGKVDIRRYWEVNPTVRERPFAELREEFLSLLEESVKLRMISDVPLGAFLSGGIDSSAIVAMMARNSERPVQTFSIGFEEKSYSELPHSRRVAELFGTEHHVRELKPDIQELILHLAPFLDEPLGDFSNYPTYLVAKTAREKVTVALSGDGGDEIFGGYEHYIAQKVSAIADFPLLRPLHPLLAQISRAIPPSPLKKGMVNRVKRMSEGYMFSPADRHFRWMTFLDPNQKESLYNPAFFHPDLAEDLHRRAAFAPHFAASRAFPGINRDLYLDLKTYLVDDIMVKVDRMSMATSLEARAPLLDHKLIEFAFSLPPRMKVRGPVTKWFFKKAMEGILPNEILYRQKEGFSIPIKNWLKTDLKPLMMETLSADRLKAIGYFNPATVTRLIDEHLQNQENHSHRLWALISFSLWHQHYAYYRD